MSAFSFIFSNDVNQVDQIRAVIDAMDLTPLILEDTLDSTTCVID